MQNFSTCANTRAAISARAAIANWAVGLDIWLSKHAVGSTHSATRERAFCGRFQTQHDSCSSAYLTRPQTDFFNKIVLIEGVPRNAAAFSVAGKTECYPSSSISAVGVSIRSEPRATSVDLDIVERITEGFIMGRPCIIRHRSRVFIAVKIISISSARYDLTMIESKLGLISGRQQAD